jgi:demethylmenaquinone methyltransferase/2-methoxy-6-polyprenyl-1,4-benzoquinol methylase
VELREEYLAIAREKFRKLGMRNVEFVLSRAEEFAPAERFDCVVSSYLAKYADLARLTRNTHAMLEPGGLLLMHDFTYPPKPVLRRVFWLYFSLMRGAGARFFPSWREIFHGLPELIQATGWLSELERELRSNRFTDLRTEYLTLYGSAIVTARK